MAISAATITRSSVVSGLNSGSSYCATCGKASAVTNKAYSGGYTGRDSYVCATCGNNGTGTASKSSSSSSTYNRSTTTTSSYCPNCNKTHSSTAHWSGGSTSSASKSSSSVANTVSWAR